LEKALASGDSFVGPPAWHDLALGRRRHWIVWRAPMAETPVRNRLQSLNDERSNRRLESVGRIPKRVDDPIFRELSVVWHQDW
jgi:hypothetical protein